MKRVSNEVAKAIKEAGYPQNVKECPFYNEEGTLLGGNYDFWKFSKKFHLFCIIPTYLDVWLWLWREKHIEFAPTHNSIEFLESQEALWAKSVDIPELITVTDPEEAIIAAIEYLVDNNLIK